MKKWDEFMQQAEERGHDLDVDLAWEEFQEKRKKRIFLPWFKLNKLAALGAALLLFAVGIGSQYHQYLLEPATPLEQDSKTGEQNIETTAQIITTQKHLSDQSQVVDPTTVTLSNSITSSAPSAVSSSRKKKDAPATQLVVANKQPSTSLHKKVVPATQLVVVSKQPSTSLHKETVKTYTSLENNIEKNLDITTNNHKYTFPINSKESVASSEQKQPVQSIKKTPFNAAPKMAILKPMLLATTSKVDIQAATKASIQAVPKRIVSKLQLKWGVGIQSAYSMPFRIVEGPKETASTRRQEVETFLESVDLQVQVQRLISDKFYLVSGLTVGQYRSSFEDHTQLIETNVPFENEVREVNIKNGISTEIRGTVYGSRTLLYTRTKYQQYVDISIPLQLGVQLPIGQTWNIKAASGVNCSLFGINEGGVISSATSIGTYTDLNTLKYRKIGLLQSISNVALVKTIHGNLDITLGLQMKRDLNSRVRNNMTIADKFHAYGASFGLMKRF